MQLEHCIDYADSPEECASEAEVLAYMGDSLNTRMGVMMQFKQIDMKNYTHPLQTFTTY